MDKKAQIKSKLQIVTVPRNTNKTHHFEAVEEAYIDWSKKNATTTFEISCVKSLTPEPVKKKMSQEEALKKHDPEYAGYIKAHPELLEPSFKQGKPVHNVWHRIETGDASPCKSKRRPIIANTKKAEKGRAAWEQMIRDGVVEEVSPGMNTDWSSALHLVDKEGGGVRPCSDFRGLNAKTVTDAHPLPLLRDFTNKIHGAKWFSKVDLRSAFFNIPIWPAHRHKTLTLSPWGGSYVYNRLAFGLSSGPSSWQKLLEHVLRDVKECCFIYLDDILVWGRTKAEHDTNLKKIFKLLAENQMALSVEKCEFGKSTVDYLGYRVTSEGIRPLPAKLQALKDFKQPLCQKDVLHFCGALNYFRSSLRGIKRGGKFKSAAAVLQPLYAIGTDKIPSKSDFIKIWQQSPSLKIAFEEAKEMLMNAVELHHPNTNYPLALFTDASDFSVGGSLQMLAPDGHYKPLGFYSAHLTETQKKYSVFKKELLGAFKSLRHFLPEIYGKHVVIYTDHLPLQQSFQSNNIPLNDPQVYRQITEIGRFTNDVRHISGIDNTFADFLSRIKPEHRGTAYRDSPELEGELAATETMQFQLVSLEVLDDLQKVCPEIKLIKSGDKPKNTNFDYATVGGRDLFCEISSNKARPYVPKELRPQILNSIHNLDHLGIAATLERTSSQYYWPSLKHDVKKYVKCCDSCMKAKAGKILVNTGEFRVPDRRFSHLMVDIVGPLPDSYGYKFLLTIICRSSRYLRALPLKEATASEAATAFLHGWLEIFGVPGQVSSDQGGSFTASLWQEMMKKLHINIKYSALYRPQANGLIERQHRSIKDSLKAIIQDMVDRHQGRWMDHLPFVLLGKNVALQPDIGASPSEMAFGLNVRVPGQILEDYGDEPETEECLSEILRKVRTNTNNQAITQTSRHSKPEKVLPEVPEGVTHVYTRQHKTPGLQAPFEGPFEVESRPSRSTVKIIVGKYKSGENRYEIRHFNDLKIAHPDSLAAPASRPKLGRPKKVTGQGDGQITTEVTAEEGVTAAPSNRFPQPPAVSYPASVNNRVVATPESANHETSNQEAPDWVTTGPPQIVPFNRRPIRATRNPSPKYVDAIWQASAAELAALNQAIGG